MYGTTTDRLAPSTFPAEQHQQCMTLSKKVGAAAVEVAKPVVVVHKGTLPKMPPPTTRSNHTAARLVKKVLFHRQRTCVHRQASPCWVIKTEALPLASHTLAAKTISQRDGGKEVAEGWLSWRLPSYLWVEVGALLMRSCRVECFQRLSFEGASSLRVPK